MTQSQRDGVRRVIRFRRRRQAADPFDHVHDLRLFSPSISDDRLLHLQRRILIDADSRLLAGQQNNAAAMCDGDARCEIGIEKKLLNGNGVRPEQGEVATITQEEFDAGF